MRILIDDNSALMALSVEAVIALVAQLFALPPAVTILWRLFKWKSRAKPHQQHAVI